VFSDNGAQRFGADDGSADPVAAAALRAYAAAGGSEHEVLTALAGTRLLVPVVATLTEPDPAGGDPPGAGPPGARGGGEKSSEMAMATLIGRDGRRAVPAFTSLDALARWQPSARPIPVTAAQVWQAAAGDSCAVVIDVAGPVPLAVEGARLAALAAGAPVPPPHADPDVRAAVAALLAAAGPPDTCRFALHPADSDGDLLIELTLPAAVDPADAEAFATRLGSAVLAQLGPRLRRGIAIALTQ
jgi:SseB protein N-terminal domain